GRRGRLQWPRHDGPLNQSFLVQARHSGMIAPDLDPWEIDALIALVSDPELLGLRPMLLPDRAEMLVRRADRMHGDKRILPPGVWLG
ncbi:MAG: hypothetical protein ACRDLA_16060, partial [Thermoleophilaceae bacterium]